MAKTNISAIVMTYNEEINLEPCLRSLVAWVDDIILVDSFSIDNTVAIARLYTDRIYQHHYEGPPQQWSWAIANTGLEHPWLLTMDADFRITPTLRQSIMDVVAQDSKDVDAYLVRRLQYFRGQPLRYGGLYPRREIRLVRHAVCQANDKEGVDQLFYVPGDVGELKGDLIEVNLKEDNISFWIQKHDRFSDQQAQQEHNRQKLGLRPLYRPTPFGNPIQRKLWLKERWYDLPLYLRPLLYFLYRYVLRLGFLDGKQGFVYHFLQAYWYRLIVDIKLEELHQEKQLPLEQEESTNVRAHSRY